MRLYSALLALVAFLGWSNAAAVQAAEESPTSLSLVVMDPLAAPLSCPCVEGYAQRDYEKLGEYLSKRLDRPVTVTFAESFEKALADEDCETIDIAIGKDSVVRHDAVQAKMVATPVARLTGKDGRTTQTGLIVVRAADPAQSVEDLHGYRILFGNVECDEKFAAPRAMLAAAGVELPAEDAAETTEACSDGACKIIEWGDRERAAAVISSYAAPLLEGCGTINKGDLRVVGETAPVPFITVFVTDRVSPDDAAAIRTAILEVANEPSLLAALESLVGFVPVDEEPPAASPATDGDAVVPAADAASPNTDATSNWSGWRGPNRDCRVAWLPNELPEEPHIVWQQELHRPGLGGIAATHEHVVLGDRDIGNAFDEFRCYAARDGTLLWTVSYPASGQLDYDNTPRATPLIYEDRVYLYGAFGHLTCAELATGKIVWQMNLLQMFDGDPELVWGTCSSPLVVDDKLIVNPGGEDASLVALDLESGMQLWQSPGDRHAYSSFIVATLGGVRQLVGYDRTTLGGWDPATGDRLWTLKPPHHGDFNVPTPVAVDGRLFVATENNGARLYEFDREGRIVAQPVAEFDELAPDVSSPAVVGNRLYCVWNDLYCLDLDDGLEPIWIGEDRAFCDSSPLFVTEDHLLAVGRGGELLLVDTSTDDFRLVSRLPLFNDKEVKQTELLSHPALVGSRLYLRGEKALVCVDLNQRRAAKFTATAKD
jgi:outer membrane protein assembly factor BamB/ABC-type phosphate/phosphonate transport system substrate-binding protein